MSSQKISILGWRGIMDDVERRARTVFFAVLAVSIVSLVFTQMGFVALGTLRLFLVLVPVAIGSLLYGTRHGTLLGLVAGVATFLHAVWMPLDYYEKFFASPVNSILMLGLTAFLLSVLFAASVRASLVDTPEDAGGAGNAEGAEQAGGAKAAKATGEGQSADADASEDHVRHAGHGVVDIDDAGGEDVNSRKAALLLAGSCLVASWFASTFFQFGAVAINALLDGRIPVELLGEIANLRSTGVQILVDAILMVLAVFVAGSIDARRRAVPASERSLRETFQAALAVVFITAFLVVSAVSHVAITKIALQDASVALDGHLDYVKNQIAERGAWADRAEGASEMTPAEREATLDEYVENLATGLPLWETGITVVAHDDVVVSSSIPSYMGKNFTELIGSGLEDGLTEAAYDTDDPLEYYLGSAADIGFLKASTISYARVAHEGQWQIAVILPADEVFDSRTIGMLMVVILFVVLLGLVFVLSMRLLDEVVVSSIDATNKTLGRITEGDLDGRVEVNETREFVALSAGINTTVGALKMSIEEAKARIDRELGTAKAIQKSALPSTFPPFPEIDRFDLYASMNAAKEVGGDFYDFFLLDGDRIGIVMADVSGKGIPAALFMMSAKTEIEACMSSGMSLAEAIGTANYRLCQGNDATMFVTVFAAILNYETGHLEYVNAGHNPPLLRRADGWEWLKDKSGLFLGAFDQANYKTFETTLSEKDLLFLYTDGVTEAMDADDNLYTDPRLEEFLREHSDLGPRLVVEAMNRELGRYSAGREQADDITILAIEYGVAPEVSASMVLPAKVESLDKAFAFVHSELARRMCPISEQNKIDICLEELFVNVANYAYPDATEDDPGKVRVSYTYRVDPQAIEVTITDEGVPFDPLAAKDPTMPDSVEDVPIGGLGIMMTKTIADEVTYEYRDKCNITSFTKSW